MSNRTVQLGKILVATDGSTDAKKAGRTAITMAKSTGAEVVFINAIAAHEVLMGVEGGAQAVWDEYDRAMDKQGKDLVDSAVAEARAAGVKARGMVMRAPGAVIESIIDTAAKEKADVVVVGTRGLGGFKKLMMGSVSQGIVTHAPCSVLVVR